MNKMKITNKYLELDPVFYHLVKPTPLEDPYLVNFNNDAAKLVGIISDKGLEKFLNGEDLYDDMQPYAMCYAGHQFGYYTPRLGDGRAINLGSVNGWNMQLKGAGKTRYSREGDGRAVLRSSIREYLVSEAMYGLGIPTTRAVAIIGSNEQVKRERLEPGSIVLRTSPSWIRFGSFEYFYYRRKHKELEALAEFTISETFEHLKDDPKRYLKMFEEIVVDTARLIASWQAVGFNHGVMNTDNMSIASLTIDYGPYAFLDDYNPDYICNHTDVEERYSFGNQPYIAEWNLSMLMQALSPIADSDKMAKILFQYRKAYKQYYIELMRKKLGLLNEDDEDAELIKSLLKIMREQPIDYTYFFRILSDYPKSKRDILDHVIMKRPFEEWFEQYDLRLENEILSLQQRTIKMKKINPKFVLKNYMLQEAIEHAHNKDFSLVDDLLAIAHNPFDEHVKYEHYAKPTPLKYKNLQLGCSS